MGKVKQAVMAKTMDDQGPDEYPDLFPELSIQPGTIIAPEDKEITLGWAIFDLKKAAKTLADNPTALTVGDLQDISEAVLQLQAIPGQLRR